MIRRANKEKRVKDGRSSVCPPFEVKVPAHTGLRWVKLYITMAKMCQDKTMRKILVIGSGGREHAILWALRNTSAEPVELFCAPGNAGIAQIAQLVNVSVDQHERLAAFDETEGIDLTF